VLWVHELRQPATLSLRPVFVGGVSEQVVARLAKTRDDSALEQGQRLSAMFHAIRIIVTVTSWNGRPNECAGSSPCARARPLEHSVRPRHSHGSVHSARRRRAYRSRPRQCIPTRRLRSDGRKRGAVRDHLAVYRQRLQHQIHPSRIRVLAAPAATQSVARSRDPRASPCAPEGMLRPARRAQGGGTPRQVRPGPPAAPETGAPQGLVS
jgi:hypothetical protein